MNKLRGWDEIDDCYIPDKKEEIAIKTKFTATIYGNKSQEKFRVYLDNGMDGPDSRILMLEIGSKQTLDPFGFAEKFAKELNELYAAETVVSSERLDF